MKLKTIGMQISTILLASIFLGLFVNQFSAAKLPLIREPVPQIKPRANYSHSQDSNVLSIDEAYTLFKTQSALFFDGRSKRFFRKVHIKGARSVYFAKVESNPILKQVNKDQLIVTYCSNIRCHIAFTLARRLRKLGFTNVYVFAAGLEEWIKARYPIEANSG